MKSLIARIKTQAGIKPVAMLPAGVKFEAEYMGTAQMIPLYTEADLYRLAELVALAWLNEKINQALLQEK